MKKLLLLVLLVFLLNPAIATYSQYDTEFTLGCENLNCSNTCNLTIFNPDETILVDNLETNLVAGYVNYTTNFTNLGTHTFYTDCSDTYYSGTFDVTLGGNDLPSDNLKIFFMIAFVGIIGAMILTLFRILEYFVKLDVGIEDVAYNFITYFALLFLYKFNIDYFSNLFMQDYFDIFIYVGGWTHIILPLTAFILTQIVTYLHVKRLRTQNG